MDYDITSGFMALALMIVFIAISGWAFNGKQRSRFDAASQLPFQEDEQNGEQP